MRHIHPKKHYRLLRQKIHNLFWYYLLPDSVYLKIRYKKVFGKPLNLKNPETFNEKIQWLKLHDRKPEYHNLVDKYEVKKIVGNLIGDEYIIPTIGVWDNYDDVDISNLPDEFILKCTHDSASVTICTDKKNFNKNEHSWKYNDICMNRDYYHFENKQWAYKSIKPRIIAEPLLKDDKYDSLADYKIYCFNGKAKCVYVMLDRFTEIKANMYDLDWNILQLVWGKTKNTNHIEKPAGFETMIKLAEKISKFVNNPFLRVDFYDIQGKIYFGEITFYPDGGAGKFTPESWDYTFGSWIDLKKGAC